MALKSIRVLLQSNRMAGNGSSNDTLDADDFFDITARLVYPDEKGSAETNGIR